MPEGVRSQQIYLGEMMPPLLCPLRIIRRCLGGMLLGLCLLVLPPAAAAAPAVDVTMENVDLQTLIKQVGTLTGTTFLFDPAQVKGKITLLSPKPLSPDEALSLLESALALHGYTLRKHAAGTWVVPAAATRPALHLEVLPLNYARAEEVAATLLELAPPGVRIAPYPPTNSLFIAGDPEAVQEILDLLRGEQPAAAGR